MSTVKRTRKGTLEKGTPSLNPTGRPKVAAEIRQALRDRLPEAIDMLMRDIREGSPQQRLEACRLLFQHALGMPPEAHLIQLEDGNAGRASATGGVPGIVFLPVGPPPEMFAAPWKPQLSIDAEIVVDGEHVDTNQQSDSQAREITGPTRGPVIRSIAIAPWAQQDAAWPQKERDDD